MKYAFTPAEVPTLPVNGSDLLFPVNRVFCVGRNYAEHAREMGMDPERDPPFFFMKPASAVIPVGKEGITIPYPPMTNNLHHEVELVVAIGIPGYQISPNQSHKLIYGYAIGLDMTRRDLQLMARAKGQPWEFGKSFASSAPIGPIHPQEKTGYLSDATINLDVNSRTRQSSNITELTWSVNEVIAHLSQYEALHAGDLIMTGTPEGVGAVVAGDILSARIAGLGTITVRIG